MVTPAAGVCTPCTVQLAPITLRSADLYVYDGVREQNVGNVKNIEVDVQSDDIPVFGDPVGCGSVLEASIIKSVTLSATCDWMTAMNLTLLTGGTPASVGVDGEKRWGIRAVRQKPVFQLRLEHLLPWEQFLYVVLRRAAFASAWKLSFSEDTLVSYPLVAHGYRNRDFADTEYGYIELTGS